jgi:multidrug resistance efflux pump
MSESSGNLVVSTPVSARMRYWRQRAVPALVWAACVAVLVLVSRQRAHYVEGIGLAEGRTSTIAPAVDGTLESVAVDLFTEIQAGQIVAVMNDLIVRAELDVASAELGRLGAVLTAERRELETDQTDRQLAALDDVRRFRMNEEDARLKYLDMTVRQETNTVELERLRIQMDRYRSLVAQNIGEAQQYDETRLRYETLKKEIEENTTAIAAAKQQLDQAMARRTERESRPLDAASEDFLLPVRSQLEVQQARIQQIRERRAQLVLRSPIDGRVAQLLRGPGETVLAGDPVLVIADRTSHRVVAYLKEDAAQRVQPGAEVLLKSQGRPQVSARARVARLGAAIENLPPAAQGMPLITQRGYPVLIDVIAPGTFIPGERIAVRIRSGL